MLYVASPQVDSWLLTPSLFRKRNVVLEISFDKVYSKSHLCVTCPGKFLSTIASSPQSGRPSHDSFIPACCNLGAVNTHCNYGWWALHLYCVFILQCPQRATRSPFHTWKQTWTYGTQVRFVLCWKCLSVFQERRLLFTPPSSVAVWNRYTDFWFLVWLDNTLHKLVLSSETRPLLVG